MGKKRAWRNPILAQYALTSRQLEKQSNTAQGRCGGGGLPESSAAVAGGEAEYGRAGFGRTGCFDSRLEAHIKDVKVHPAASYQSDGCGWPDWWLPEASTEARGAHVYSPAREGGRHTPANGVEPTLNPLLPIF